MSRRLATDKQYNNIGYSTKNRPNYPRARSGGPAAGRPRPPRRRLPRRATTARRRHARYCSCRTDRRSWLLLKPPAAPSAPAGSLKQVELIAKKLKGHDEGGAARRPAVAPAAEKLRPGDARCACRARQAPGQDMNDPRASQPREGLQPAGWAAGRRPPDQAPSAPRSSGRRRFTSPVRRSPTSSASAPPKRRPPWSSAPARSSTPCPRPP